MPSPCWRVAAILACISLLVATPLPTQGQETCSVDYLVIGAGPGGLQAAHFLAHAGHSYVVVEAAPSAASFFETFPRFRGLISINKVNTGMAHPDFNLRHDWNSLLHAHYHEPEHVLQQYMGALGSEKVVSVGVGAAAEALPVQPQHHGPLLFSNFSQDYNPHADDLVAYMKAFAAHEAIDVHYNVTVTRISRAATAAAAAPARRFEVNTVPTPGSIVVASLSPSTASACGGPSGGARTYEARHLLVATGLAKPTVLPTEGIELAEK